MKIAVVTQDGNTVHPHFGQAPYYEILTVEGDRVTARERRHKPAHTGHHEHGGYEHHHPCRDSHAEDMATVIADCQVVLARGMGQPAFRKLQATGIEPVVVEEQTIDQAVETYLHGPLRHRAARIHGH